jgi:hypothetical protein
MPLWLFYLGLGEMPGVARDYVRNEGARKINLVLYKNNYNLQRFKPPEKDPRYSMNRRRGGPQNRSGCQATAPEQTPKSKSHYDRRPVGQCVLVSSPIWGSWPDINYCVTVTVLSISGAPSDERSGLSFDLVTWTASVQYSRFDAGPRQYSISPYL